MSEDVAKKKGLDVRDQVLWGKQLDVRDQVALENQNIKPLNSVVNISHSDRSSTMSHREIAGLIGKESRHVKRDCDSMFKELNINPVGYAQPWTHPQNGQTYIEYMLTRDLVETLITGYSIKLRHAVLNRLRELEKLAAQPVVDLNNPEFLRQALLGYTEKVIELEHKVQKLEPKAQALDDIAATTSTFCIRDAAKTVGVSEKVFIQFLLNQNWVYRSKDGYNTLVAYGKRINQKVMAEKVTRVIETSKGPQVFTQARITSKGLTRLAAMVRDAGLVEGVAA
ncbi:MULTISPECIES: phage regulatory protein/antirepressor Ant [unclassified Acinetobacter]|uniref:phage regulatory protein/antirepressor Ant n=1 Tax=unclassified Acinetobacter TaxID=196816 RepID=UPI0021B77670|nr:MULTISPECIES: phage regulatory protein/antirepressor Ant [unclassified Acinetobacter]